MGGTIGVESEGKAKGSTFWFTSKVGLGVCLCKVQLVPDIGPLCDVLVAYADPHTGASLAQLIQSSYSILSFLLTLVFFFE